MPGYRPVLGAAEWTECDECRVPVLRTSQPGHDAYHDRLTSPEAHMQAHALVAVLEQAKAS